ncbi:hypothetical protein [Bosea sp. 124]|uniref:hypothetical protein n=1 Tax=Bosea sp. 124 TaxID=2135642 RepID=UPI000D3A8005|nr:hypothetical protein [Bosea sp. 124]PTM39349.1 hypothetical protein C8D03_0838 [Bosea sp. 124]
MKTVTALVLGFIVLAATLHPATAQDGCKAAQSSCSQINASCEQKCQAAGNNPSGCIARLCSATFSTCKANGVWKAPGSAGCWKTNNRT